MRSQRVLFLAALMLLGAAVFCSTEKPVIVQGVQNISVEDYKYDSGESVILKFSLSPDDTLSQGNPVKYYRILIKRGWLEEDEKINPDDFREIQNITSTAIAKSRLSEALRKDKSVKEKFRYPFLDDVNGEKRTYCLRLKNLKQFFLNPIENNIAYYRYIVDEYKVATDISKEEKKSEIKKIWAEIIKMNKELKTLRKELNKDLKLTVTVVAESAEGIKTFSHLYQTFEPKVEAVNLDKLSVFIVSIAFVILLLIIYQMTKMGKEFYVRPIAGLSAVEEAVGRATEMGRPVLYIGGLSGISDIATLASINILGQIAKKVAIYETPLIVPAYDPIVYSVMREVVREAYIDVGKPEAFQEENIFYLTSEQFAYAAGVNGIMVRERPATIFHMGMFFAESLLMSETGNQVGAIQIAGTDAVTQIPFFITSCDYTLIGEELYAASAYLSKEPLLLSTLKAQDYGKLAIMVGIILGIVLELLGVTLLTQILQNIPE